MTRPAAPVAPVALVAKLARGRANAIDMEFVSGLSRTLDEAEASGRPLVLTGNGRFFSAGLDLAGLPQDREEMGGFVDRFDDLLRRLFLFPCPTVAAVNGHAVAGGAILAAACDVRIGAAGDYRIGVSEVQLGVIFPAFAFEVLRAAIPAARTAEVLLRGQLSGPRGRRRERFPARAGAAGRAGPAGHPKSRRTGEACRAMPMRIRSASFAPSSQSGPPRNAPKKREHFLDTWFSEHSRGRFGPRSWGAGRSGGNRSAGSWRRALQRFA